MPDTCQHGLPANDCLICKTLPAQQSARPERAAKNLPDGTDAKKGSLGLHVAGVVVGIVVVGLIAWAVAGVVFALLHILELVLVAGVAAWAGYRIGRFRGRREH